MRKVALSMSLLVLGALAVGLSMAVPDTTAPVETVASVEGVEPVELVCQAPDLFQAILPFGPPFTPNYCGDPCSTPGQQVGCIDTSSQPWVRTFCTCVGGYLVC